MPSSVIPSPNMSLPVPQVGIDSGPDWATQINNCLSLIDSHNHAPGQGVLIDQTGISLSGDLVFNTNSATFLFSTQFVSQGSTTSITNGLYVVGGNLWYNNASATPVQITSGGSIVGSSGSISGLVSPSSASYNSGTDTFVWQSNAGPNAANMDFASATFRSPSSGSDGVTVNPPAVIPPGGYNLFLPTQPSANNTFVTMNTDGTMNSSITPDGTTCQIVGSNLSVIFPTPARGSPVVYAYATPAVFATPAGCTWIRVRLVGGGGGGGGGGNAGTGSNGGNGGPTQFSDGTNSCQATGGTGGTRTAGAQGAGGVGTVTGAVTQCVGTYGSEGQGGITAQLSGTGVGTGGSGGSSFFGGAGFGGVSGNAGGAANGWGSGGGGGSGATGFSAYYGGGGGAAGGYVEAIFYTPSSSYTLSMGGGGTAGNAGTSGFAGGGGGSGFAIIEYYFN